MTKKNYITLAALINANPRDFSRNAVSLLADCFEKDNPQFDRERWIAACFKRSHEWPTTKK